MTKEALIEWLMEILGDCPDPLEMEIAEVETDEDGIMISFEDDSKWLVSVRNKR